MKIKSNDVEKIANLARLDLREGEAVSYGTQLSNILGYIEKLNELDTGDIAPTSHVGGLKNVTRPDEIEKPLSNDEALSNAPDPSNGFYRVPKIIE